MRREVVMDRRGSQGPNYGLAGHSKELESYSKNKRGSHF